MGRIDGKTASENSLYFGRARELRLPVPVIRSQITRHGTARKLTRHSDGLARDVFVSFGDLDVTVSDNYLELRPGQTRTLTITSDASDETLERSLVVTTLAEVMARGHR